MPHVNLPAIRAKALKRLAVPRVLICKDWSESSHPRAQDGKFGSGGAHADAQAKLANHAAGGVPKTHAELTAKADDIADKHVGKAAQLLANLKGPAVWMRGKTDALRVKLTQKYGVKGATAIIAAGQVITWGITIGAPLATGLPIVVPPGGGLATSLALAGVVDLYVKMRGTRAKGTDELTPEEAMRIAAEIVQELIDGAHAQLAAEADVQEKGLRVKTFDESKIHRAADGTFGEGGAAHQEAQGKLEASRAHFLNNEQGKPIFFVTPGANGKENVSHVQDRKFGEKLFKAREEQHQKATDDLHNNIGDVFTAVSDESMTADEAYAKVDQLVSDYATKFSDQTDADVKMITDAMKESYGEDWELGDWDETEKRIEAAKEDVTDKANNLLAAFEGLQEHGDIDAAEEELTEAQEAMESASKEAQSEVSSAIEEHHESLERAGEERDEDWQSEASDSASQLDEYGDDLESANSDAATYNANLEAADNPYRVWFDEDAGEWAFGNYEDLDDWPGKKEKMLRTIRRKLLRTMAKK